MFLLLLLLALSLLPPPLHAHYSFAHLITPSTPSSPAWTYIRQPGFPSSTETTGEWQPGKPGAPLGSIIPPSVDQSLRATPLSSRHVSSPEFRCGREGWKEHDQTGTADVRGGEVVGVGVEVFWSFSINPVGLITYDSITHIGPAQAYLARKPEGVRLSRWDGDGDWFKIDYTGATSNTTWALLGAKRYNVTIPKTTPPGEYLLRVEQIFPSTGNTSEFFVNCAQINVIGPGGGTPTGFVKFPGAYQPDEVALSLPEGEEIVNGTDAAAIRWRHGFLGYVPPGPAVWRG